MSVRWPRGWRTLGLLGAGLLAGAVLPAAARAQRPDTTRARPDTAAIPIPPRPDSLLADTTRRDTTRVVRDSIQAPFATAPMPPLAGDVETYVWDRASIFTSGAQTLTDLLQRVPGVTDFRAGWLLTPEQVSYAGAFGRVRIFYDGIELDPLDARTARAPVGVEGAGANGPTDLATIELWPLEQVAVERGATELRVHLRSWRVRSTTPDTRTDIATGEPNTNQFRGFFGRRFENGAGVQFGFQQLSTGQASIGGDGDQLGLVARVGWASRTWSVDAYATRSRRVRADLQSFNDDEGFAPVPGIEDARMLGYVRLGFRDPLQSGLWAQLVAASDSYDESSDRREATALIPRDTADTSRSRAQYVASAGWNLGALRLEGTGRLRAERGERWFSPAVRAALARGWWAAEAYAERSAHDSTQRVDAAVRVAPLSFLWAAAALSRSTPTGDEDGRESLTGLRGEVGLRVRRASLFGGVISRDGGVTGAPVVFEPRLLETTTGRVTGLFGGIRGRVYRDVSADVLFTRWDQGDEGLLFQPQYELRGELQLDTRWLSRFPSGEFGVRAAVIADYRSDVRFLRESDDPAQTAGEVWTTLGTTDLTGLLEIRIQEATLFFQSRNLFSLEYELVPGLRMPRQFLLYGVRWQFWN